MGAGETERKGDPPSVLSAYLRAGSIPITYLGRDGTVVEINSVGLANLQRPRDQVVGRSIFTLIPSMAQVIGDRIERVFVTRGSVVVVDDVPLPEPDDQAPRRFRSTLDPVFDDAGDVIAVQVRGEEITVDFETAASMARANRKIAMIFGHAPFPILTLVRDGTVTYINRAGPGYRVEDVIGMDSHDFVHPESRADYHTALSTVFDGAATTFEFPDVRGSWWESTLVPVFHEGRVEQCISFSVEITERRRAEQERARLEHQALSGQKLESLGVLAGGIAHDFNNLLMVITGNTDLARVSIGPGTEAGSLLDDALIAAARASDLCAQMLAYAGRSPVVRLPVDLSRLVAEMTQLVSVSVSKGVQLRRELGTDLPAIDGDPTQLRQVVLNLITNASDAIGDGQGVVTVRVRAERLGVDALDGILPPSGLEPGHYVVLEVEDTGCGIDAATRERMFEPFFTTKQSGRGLGLSATLGTVRKHRGGLVVNSTPGVGTTIRVVFPALAGKSASEEPRAEPAARVGRGLILVIDDEAGIRKIARKVLAQGGYETVLASDGIEGLARYDELKERVRLVLLDLTMPVLGGEATLRALRERAPTVPVVIMSGYSEAVRREDANVRFLAKPFGVKDLLDAIGSALDERLA